MRGGQVTSCLDSPIYQIYMKKYTIPSIDVMEVTMLSNIMLESPTALKPGGDTTKPISPWSAPGRKPF